jgi:hypothetical protein
MKQLDVPDEVDAWLSSQEKPFTIFVPGCKREATIAFGTRLPEVLCEMYEAGLLEHVLTDIGYEEDYDGSQSIVLFSALAKCGDQAQSETR